MAPNVFAAVLILAICAFIVFPLRLYIRITKNAWGYDDWCMSIGAVSRLALIGRHHQPLTSIKGAIPRSHSRLPWWLFPRCRRPSIPIR